MMIVAREKGLFEREGLAPSFTSYASGKRALIDGVLADQADLTAASDLSVSAQLGQGGDLVILARLQAVRSINSIVARKDRGIARIADLAGKRVGTEERSAVHFFLDRALMANGVDPADVEHAYSGAEELAAALAAGKVDALSMREPVVSQAVALLGANAVVLDAPWVYAQFELLVADRTFAENHPDEMKRVLRALINAERFMFEQPRATEAIVAAALKISPEAARRVMEQSSNRLRLPQALLPLMEEQLRWLGALAPGGKPPSVDLLAALHLAPLLELQPQRIGIAGYNPPNLHQDPRE